MRSLLLLVLGWGLQATAVAAGPPAKPNVLVILADDLGYSDLGCHGGEIATPNLDRLAAGGLRFTQFYNTARCWPTRSAFITGYHPQQVRMDPPRGRLPAWARTLPERLRPLGYRSYQSGKWHVQGAPLVRADGGFDRSLELQDFDRNFFPQKLVEDDVVLPPVPRDAGYYTTAAFADHTIRCLREHAEKHAGQPFFAYLAFTVPHFPLHAQPEDIARYRDRYLEGWDAVRERRWRRLRELGIVTCALAPREPDAAAHWSLAPEALKERIGPGEVGRAVAWEALSEAEKRFQATKMAIHAAMVDRMDREVGRVLDQLRAMGAFEDTIILFASDNGASAEQIIRGDGHDPAAPPGSAATFLCLGPGWSSASNAPFRLHKSWVYEGGIATPLIVHWPRGIAARGELRHDVGHVIDLVPTLLELAGVKAEEAAGDPRAPPFPGRSLVPAFARDGAVVRDELFFHHDQNRALRRGDWKLVSGRPEQATWRLYHLKDDRCEAVDVASEHPDRVREMAARWEALEKTFREQAGPAEPAGKEAAR